jgi:hypothetical protein
MFKTVISSRLQDPLSRAGVNVIIQRMLNQKSDAAKTTHFSVNSMKSFKIFRLPSLNILVENALSVNLSIHLHPPWSFMTANSKPSGLYRTVSVSCSAVCAFRW